MPRKTLFLPLFLALSIVAMAATAAAQPRVYHAPLSGAEEVPPVQTLARGHSTFLLSSDGTRLHFLLIVAHLENVEQAHIHLGARGENGPVVAWLYPEGPPPQRIPGFFSGILAHGVITSDDLVGPLQGMPLSQLVAHIESGNAYVNVHTEQHPAGEIRGQIR